MKAIQIHDAHDIVFGDVSQPEPGPGEVLVRVRSTGICGTDVEIVEGTMPYYTQGMAKYPIIPGHEWAGEVAGLGAGVSHFAIGDRVVGECSVGCGQCSTCLAGNYHQCPTRRETGILNLNGGFAQFMTFPAIFLHKVRDDLPFATACLVEPCAVAFNGVRRTEITPRDYVVIFGDGPIGLLTLQMARAFGANRVAVVGATDHRLAKAAELGADAVLDVRGEDVAESLQRLGGDQLPDAVIEATGNPAAAEQAVQVVRPGGRLTLLGIFGGRKASLDLDKLVIGDITLRGALGSPGVWPDVIRLIEAGRVDPAAIISHQMELADFSRGIEMVQDRADGVVKIVLTQNGD